MVEVDSNGQVTMLATENFDAANPQHVNVSEQFRQLTLLNFFVSTFMCVNAGYQVIAFSCSKELLKYRFFVSRFNKLVLACFVILIGCIIKTRLSPAAKFCSGDHLTYDEWRHRFAPHRSREFLVKMGFILKMYVNCVMMSLVIFLGLGLYLAYSLKGLFS